MAKTGEELTDEIRGMVGRDATVDVGVITDARIARWLNESQVKIVEKCVGLHGMGFKNPTSLDTTVTLAYAISDITVCDSTSDYAICRITDVYYLDGLNSYKLTWMATDEFDEAYPDPTNANIPKSKPTHWTRRGGNIEMFPLCVTANCDKDLRFDGDFYAGDFTVNDASVSDISGADEGLISYGIWKAWGAIGGNKATLEEIKWKKAWNDWLDDFRSQNDDLDEWDGKMFGDELI